VSTPRHFPNYSFTLVEVQNGEEHRRLAPLLSTSTLSLGYDNSKFKRRLGVARGGCLDSYPLLSYIYKGCHGLFSLGIGPMPPGTDLGTE